MTKNRENNEDTIAAISTGLTPSGIGIVRISGTNAISLADKVFQSKRKDFSLKKAATHTLHYGWIRDEGEILDEVLVSVMRSPHTYTAEDTVEINTHGGMYAMRRVLEAVISAGARLAMPGEFTRRAFLNGRMDLSQAEAVMDLIEAKNEYALRNSVSQLSGSVRKVIEQLRSEILLETARIESALDDPEHYDLTDYPAQLSTLNGQWIGTLQRMINSSENGRLIQEGIRTVIIGKPNVGKSSLLNALLGEERAIVTSIPGTTRDTLTEILQLEGITLKITDTAGIRETSDEVESIGVKKARQSMEEADLVICVLDASAPLDAHDEQILQTLTGKKSMILLNKTDLTQQISVTEVHAILQKLNITPLPSLLEISAKEMKGLTQFAKTIHELFLQGEISLNDEILITNVRQKEKLKEAKEDLQHVEESIQMQMPEDFFSIDLTAAYTALGEMIGEETGEDLINEIFGKFCMGK